MHEGLCTLCDSIYMKSRYGQILFDSIYVKCPEWANPPTNSELVTATHWGREHGGTAIWRWGLL